MEGKPIKSRMEYFKERAKKLKRDVYALYIAVRRKDVPWYAKVFGVIVVGYALSPIDLIPDFVPVLGYLDDLFIVPGGIWIILKMIPQNVMEECRAQAEEKFTMCRPKSYLTAIIIVLLWLAIIGFVILKIIM
jgi:Uncharacterized conserved protein